MSAEAMNYVVIMMIIIIIFETLLKKSKFYTSGPM